MHVSQLHSRSSKRPAARPSRPAQNHRHSSSKPQNRPSSSRGNIEITVEEEQPDEDAMTTTFPQYCTVCDKQIIIPSSSILYCSERCRKQDCNESPSYVLFTNDTNPPAPSPMYPNLSAFETPSNISPAPTSASHSHSRSRSFDNYPSESSPSDTENLGSSMVKTSKRSTRTRKETEASRYLAQFQPTDYFNSQPRTGRSSGHTTPILSITPTSSTSASMPYTPTSTSSSRISLNQQSSRWSTSAHQTRSLGLVTPIVQCPTAPSSLTTITDKLAKSTISDASTPIDVATVSKSERLSYEKRSPARNAAISPQQSSLQQLLQIDQR